MPANSPLTADQLIQLSADFNGLGNLDRAILNDPNTNLSPGQASSLASDLTSFSNIAAHLATWGAIVAFQDSDAAFTKISTATQAANAKVAQIQGIVAKINAVVSIFGAAVSLGVAFGTGNVPTILSAADKLRQAVTSA